MFETLLQTIYGALPALDWCGRWGGGFFGGRGFGMMGGYWPFGMLFMGIFWIAVIAFIVWAIWRVAGGRRMAHTTTESHLDILKRRLASGEITADEFAKIRKTLEQKK